MPDLLTHVLFAYALATLLSLRYSRLSSAYVTIVMIGALVPDLNHISVLVASPTIERVLGVPFDWGGLQTGGVVLLVVLVGTLLVERVERTHVFALLSVGAVSHLLADALIRVPDGRSQSLFWPLSRYQPPSPGLYTSTDLWPLIVAICLAAGSWYFVRYGEQNAFSDQR